MAQDTPLVLIGGFGFIGRNILEALTEHHGFAALVPSVIDDLSNAAPGYENTKVSCLSETYAGAGTTAFLDSLPVGPRIFVFLAGETRVAESADRPLDFIAANIDGPARFVADHMRPGDRFILVSTAGALFDGSFRLTTSAAYSPKNFYGATKAAEEMLLQQLVAQRGGKFAAVRLTNVFGKYSDRKKSAIHAFVRAALCGERVTLHGDGRQTRDFIFAGDVGRGIATLAEQMRTGSSIAPFHMIGAGKSHSLSDIVRIIEEVTGNPLPHDRDPAVALLATEPRDVITDPKEATALLGGRVTSLDEGIRVTCGYYTGA